MIVILYVNGIVAVFNQHGEQIPELQGPYDAVKEQIRAVYQGPWCFGVWNRWIHEDIPFEAIEFTVKQLKKYWQ